MPSITVLEQVLRRPDGRRHALALTRVLRHRRQRLLRACLQPQPQQVWQSTQQLIIACDAAIEIIATLYRRYHNQIMEPEDFYDNP